ncbi:MAG: HAD family hydrolase [Flexilinea sp.]
MDRYAVLFDFDGTLFFGTAEINYFVINKALADMGRLPILREEANSTVGDKLIDSCKRILLTDDEPLAHELLQGLIRHTPEAIEKMAEIEPDCVYMLKTLYQYTPLAICSNAEAGYLDSLTEKFGIRQYFQSIWHRKDGYNKKKAIPELIRILHAKNAIMVGDRAEDITAGKANGCITVAIQNDFGSRDAAGADYDVQNHKEMGSTLLKILQELR